MRPESKKRASTQRESRRDVLPQTQVYVRALSLAALMATAAPTAAQPLALTAAATAPAPAQTAGGSRVMDEANLRRHIYVMEGVLERAVQLGASNLNREIRTAMPEMIALSGEPRVRGVYLEGYGIYFDVAVPVINQVMMWSLRSMLGPDDSVLAALAELRTHAQSEKNPGRREFLRQQVESIERHVGTQGGPGLSSSRPVATKGVDTVDPTLAAPQVTAQVLPQDAGAAFDRKYFQDPNAIHRAYTEAVQTALIDTLLDHAMSTALKTGEVLVVAARDDMRRDHLAPPDPYEEVVTVMLTVRAADLRAYRSEQIDAAEMRRRVKVTQF